MSAAVAISLAYFLLPLPPEGALRPSFLVTAFALGLLAISLLIIWRVVEYRRRVTTGTTRVRGLAVSLFAAVLYFAYAYSAIARSGPQFADLVTRVDALYLSMAVVTTVGFGDVHATGQIARAVVTVQMVWDVAFLGLAVTAARSASPLSSPPSPGPGPTVEPGGPSGPPG